MKKCIACQQAKPLSEFHKKGKTPGGKPRWRNDCKACKAIIDLDNYDKDRTAQRQKALKKRNKDIVVQHLKDNPCVDCGENDIVVLEFDHVRGAKIDNISVMVAKHAPIERLLDEIAKCEVRCANCHRRITATRGKWSILDY